MKYLLAFLLLVASAHAAIIPAASASRADVGAAVAIAVSGDIVLIPPGLATWGSQLSITGISLQGAGSGSTIITDGITNTTRLIRATLVTGFNTRITGIGFTGGAVRVDESFGPIRVDGTSSGYAETAALFRIDHCAFTNFRTVRYIEPFGCLGVIDHNTFTKSTTAGTSAAIFITPWGVPETGDAYGYGDFSWAAGTLPNSAKNVFIEDNTFTMSNGQTGGAVVTDAFGGARFVVRHNTMINCWCSNHGTESAQRFRGGQIMDIYSNDFTLDATVDRIANFRSGTGVVTLNTITKTGSVYIQFNQDRVNPTIGNWPPWGTANGNDQWDSNEAGGPFATGTIATVPSSGNLTVSGTPWSTNQFAGYSVTVTSGTPSPNAGVILSNTSNQLTFVWRAGFGDFEPVVGNSIAIYKVNQVLDGIGRGNGSSLGGTTVPTLPWTAGQNDQTTVPIYIWSNTINGSGGNPSIAIFPQDAYTVVENTHYFVGTAEPGWVPFTYPYPWPADDTVAAPSFSPPAGTYGSTQSVTISSTTPGATIRYTTNGSTPTNASGTVYSTPVSISSTTTLKAIAYNGVLIDSTVTSGTYTISGGGGSGNLDVAGTLTVTGTLTLPP